MARSFKYECLLVHEPKTVEEIHEVTQAYVIHYNEHRPHQGRVCGNRPPRAVFPTLPQRPALPAQVDPDGWLAHVNGQGFVRRIKTDGRIVVDYQPYSIKQALAGQSVSLVVNATERCFDVFLGVTLFKQIPIKGLGGTSLPLDAFVELMREQAQSEERLRRLQHPRRAS